MATNDTSRLPPDLEGLLGQFRNTNFLPRPNTPPVWSSGMYPSPNTPYGSLSDQILDAFRVSRTLPGGPANQFANYNIGRYNFAGPFGKATPAPPRPAPPAPNPMPRPNAPVPPDAGGRGGVPLQPDPRQAPTPFQRPGSRQQQGLLGNSMAKRATDVGPSPQGSPQGSGGLLQWQDAQKYMGADEIARLGKNINAQGQYDPAGPNSPWSAANLTATFNSLPEDRRGDFVNAVSQAGAATGIPNIGATIQQALRDSMGKSQHDNWYAGVQNRQGSNIMSTAGLPSWLTAVIK